VVDLLRQEDRESPAGKLGRAQKEEVMVEYKHGSLTLTVDDSVVFSKEAGTLSAKEVARLAKAPPGALPLCEDAASAIEKAGGSFAVPPGVTPQSLRQTAARAQKLELMQKDAEVVVARLRQQAMLEKADAYEQVRKVNDAVKAQGKHNREVRTLFGRVLAFFSFLRGKKKPEEQTYAPLERAPIANAA
jgi:hypothetical protein